MAGALILNVVYGLEITSRDDPALIIAEEALHAFSEIADAGSYLGIFSVNRRTSKTKYHAFSRIRANS